MADPGKIASQMLNDVARARTQQPAAPASRPNAEAGDRFAPSSGTVKGDAANRGAPIEPNGDRFTLKTLSTMAGLLVEALEARSLPSSGSPSTSPKPGVEVGSRGLDADRPTSADEGRPLRPGSRIDIKA